MLEHILHRETLNYAVSRAITCPSCGLVLDVRRAVYVDGHVGLRRIRAVACGACYDRDAKRLAEVLQPGAEIIDGREMQS